MKVSISDSAFNDLENLLDYSHQQGVPSVGMKFAKAITEQIEILSDHPDIGRIVPEFAQEHIRELIHAPFRIVYLRIGNAITVIRVWRSERLLVLPARQI